MFNTELLFLSMALSWSRQTSAFVISTPSPKNPPCPLGAMVFDGCSWSDETPHHHVSLPLPGSSSPATDLIRDSISRNRVGTLARLAAAYAPVRIQDIEHVKAVHVDTEEIGIEAVVCDNAQCVTLHVPVRFPHDRCDGISFEECVLHKLEMLDHEAEEKLLQQSRQDERQEKYDLMQRELLSSSSEDESFLPSWWVPPGTGALLDSCTHMKSILNDFSYQHELVSLAHRGLQLAITDKHLLWEDLVMEQVAIVAISPAGLYMKAKMTAASAGGSTTIDIPFRFDKVADSPEVLQDSILTAIADSSSSSSSSDNNNYYGRP